MRGEKRSSTSNDEVDASEREHKSLVVGEWEATKASHSTNNRESCGSFWCPTRGDTSMDVL
jgi:hypothetical protein